MAGHTTTPAVPQFATGWCGAAFPYRCAIPHLDIILNSHTLHIAPHHRLHRVVPATRCTARTYGRCARSPHRFYPCHARYRTRHHASPTAHGLPHGGFRSCRTLHLPTPTPVTFGLTFPCARRFARTGARCCFHLRAGPCARAALDPIPAYPWPCAGSPGCVGFLPPAIPHYLQCKHRRAVPFAPAATCRWRFRLCPTLHYRHFFAGCGLTVPPLPHVTFCRVTSDLFYHRQFRFRQMPFSAAIIMSRPSDGGGRRRRQRSDGIDGSGRRRLFGQIR